MEEGRTLYARDALVSVEPGEHIELGAIELRAACDELCIVLPFVDGVLHQSLGPAGMGEFGYVKLGGFPVAEQILR